MATIFTMAEWGFDGVVLDLRELKTKEAKTVWAHAVKLACGGGTYEARLGDARLLPLLASGIEGHFGGRFEEYNGGIQLILMTFKEAAKPGGKAAA